MVIDSRIDDRKQAKLAVRNLTIGYGSEPILHDVNLTLRLEASVPQAPDDPFTVLGVYPRLLVGCSFGI